MLQVYSKNNCPICVQAKTFLDRKNVPYEEIKIDQNTEARQMLLSAGHKSVPQIYHNGKLFVEGGFAGLSNLPDSVFEQFIVKPVKVEKKVEAVVEKKTEEIAPIVEIVKD